MMFALQLTVQFPVVPQMTSLTLMALLEENTLMTMVCGTCLSFLQSGSVEQQSALLLRLLS